MGKETTSAGQGAVLLTVLSVLDGLGLYVPRLWAMLPMLRGIIPGGLLLLAVVIGGGSWLLLRAGVEPQTITVLGILLLFIGAIGLTAAVELCKKRKS